MRKQKLPTTDSIEELASFWDTHDVTEFEEELEEVGEPVFVGAKGASLSIALPATEAQRLKTIARPQGVEETTVLRRWILERLQGSSSTRRAPKNPPAAPKRRGR